jgi:hypothetical protein
MLTPSTQSLHRSARAGTRSASCLTLSDARNSADRGASFADLGSAVELRVRGIAGVSLQSAGYLLLARLAHRPIFSRVIVALIEQK